MGSEHPSKKSSPTAGVLNADLLSSIVRQSEDAIIAKDLDGNILYWNHGAEKLYGYTAQEATGESITILIPDNRLQEYQKIMEKLRRGESIEHYQTVLVTKNGDHIDVSVTISALRDFTGSLIGAASISRNITKQRLVQMERETLASIVDSSEDAIISHTADGIIVSWNKAAERIYGYNGEEVLGHHISMLTPPELIDETQSLLRRIRNGERIHHYETKRMRKDGVQIDVSLTVSPILDSNGIIIGVSKIVRDITLLKALQRERSLLAMIVESSSDAILSKTMEGIIISWNKGAENLYGYTADEIIGKHVSVLAAPEVINEIPAILGQLAKGEKIENYETIRVKKNGERIHIWLNISPIINERGAIVGASAIARDITDRKRADLLIRRQLSEKEVLLQEVHHRVKNNLQIISSLLDLRSREADKEFAFLESIERIRAISLVHEMLYRSPTLATVDFQNYLRNLGEHLMRSYHKSIEFVVSGDNCSMSLDTAVPLGLVFNEMITNSVKYAFPSGEPGKIQINTKLDGGFLTASFSDNGIGLDTDFDIGKASSFGFRIIKLLIRQVNGTIQTESKQKGARFVLTIPVGN